MTMNEVVEKLAKWFKKNKKELWTGLLILMLPILIYSGSLAFEMTYFDDHEMINSHLEELRDKSMWQEMIWGRDAFLSNEKDFTYYRPGQNFSFWLDVQLSGNENPDVIMHLHNVLLFAGIGWLFYILLRKVLYVNKKWALILTIFLIMNPMLVSLAVWIPSRGDLLISFWGLLSFLGWAKLLSLKLEKEIKLWKSICWGIFTGLSLGIAIISKETALMWPIIMSTYYFIVGPRPLIKLNSKSTKKEVKITKNLWNGKKLWQEIWCVEILIVVAITILTTIAWWWARAQIDSSLPELSITALLSYWRVIPESIAKFVLPLKVNLLPLFELPAMIIGLGLVLIIAGVMIWPIIKNAPTDNVYQVQLWGIIWFLAFTIPPLFSTSSYLKSLIDYVNHRVYLPILGLLIWIAVWPVVAKRVEKLNNWIISIILGVIIIAGGIISWRQSQLYDGPIVYWTTVIEQNPNSPFAYYNLGTVYQDKKMIEESITAFSKAIEMDNTDARYFNNRGLSYGYQGKYDLAAADYQKVIELDPGFVLAYNNLAAVQYLNLNDPQAALENLNQSIKMMRNDPMAYSLRALVKESLEDYQGAWNDLDIALSLDPKATQLITQMDNLQAKMDELAVEN